MKFCKQEQKCLDYYRTIDGKIVNPTKENAELSKYVCFLKEEWNILFSLTSEEEC